MDALTHAERKELHHALVDAFRSWPDFEELFEAAFRDRLVNFTQNEGLELVAKSVIECAESRGRIIDLVSAAETARSSNPALRAFVVQYRSRLLRDLSKEAACEIAGILQFLDNAALARATEDHFPVLSRNRSGSRRSGIYAGILVLLAILLGVALWSRPTIDQLWLDEVVGRNRAADFSAASIRGVELISLDTLELDDPCIALMAGKLAQTASLALANGAKTVVISFPVDFDREIWLARALGDKEVGFESLRRLAAEHGERLVMAVPTGTPLNRDLSTLRAHGVRLAPLLGVVDSDGACRRLPVGLPAGGGVFLWNLPVAAVASMRAVEPMLADSGLRIGDTSYSFWRNDAELPELAVQFAGPIPVYDHHPMREILAFAEKDPALLRHIVEDKIVVIEQTVIKSSWRAPGSRRILSDGELTVAGIVSLLSRAQQPVHRLELPAAILVFVGFALISLLLLRKYRLRPASRAAFCVFGAAVVLVASVALAELADLVVPAFEIILIILSTSLVSLERRAPIASPSPEEVRP